MQAEVVGGVLAGHYDDINDLVAKAKGMGFQFRLTPDRTELRNKGCLVARAELDNQPQFIGCSYLGPFWDGGCLRYETPEIYNMMSD